jgi:putative SOS response-associated peptidase YedK
MRVIVVPRDCGAWLGTAAKDAPNRLSLLRAASSEEMEAYRISMAVSNPKNEGRELIDLLA